MLDYPEIKHDIDIWYKPTTENFENIIKSIEELGVETTELKEVIFDPLKTYLRIPHTYFKIEFLPQMKGLESFSQSRSKALVQVLDNNRILIINLEDLLTNKAAVDRQIDRTDIKELRKRNPGDQELRRYKINP